MHFLSLGSAEVFHLLHDTPWPLIRIIVFCVLYILTATQFLTSTPSNTRISSLSMHTLTPLFPTHPPVQPVHVKRRVQNSLFLFLFLCLSPLVSIWHLALQIATLDCKVFLFTGTRLELLFSMLL